jgi:tetratricopeptide (TPR) repeat protein
VGLILLSQFGTTSNEEKAKALFDNAQLLSQPKLEKFDVANEPLSPEDRTDLLQAANDFEQAKVLLPTSYKGSFGAGFVYVALEDWGNAATNLQQALAMPPVQPTTADLANMAQAHYLYARVLIATGKYADAEKQADAAVKFANDSPNYLWARASARVQLRKIEEAQEDLRKALSVQPDHAPSQSLLKFISNMK